MMGSVSSVGSWRVGTSGWSKLHTVQANVHAIALIVLLAGALLSLVTLRRREPTGRQWLIAIAVAFFGAAAAFVFNQHMCREGVPVNQWLLLAPCLLLILAFVSSAVWRRVLAAIVFIGMVGLSCHFAGFVHTPGWTGNQGWDGGAEISLRSLQKCAAVVAGDADDANAVMPEGWLRDSPRWDAVQELYGDRHPARRQIQPVWHSALTGFYQYTAVPQDFWYPGGPFTDGVARIELRDRAALR